MLFQDGHNNNGYVPYVDYTRDYNPPLTRNSIYNGQANGGMQSPPQYLNNVDPRYSATYGNPYLRTSNTSLPPPHSGAGNHSPNSGSHPLAHSGHHLLNNHHPHHHHTPTSSNHIAHNHIVSTPTSTSAMIPNGSLGGGSIGGGSGSGSPLIPGSTSPLSHSQGNTLSNSTNPYGMRNGAVPQVSRAPSTPSPQYIVPSQPQLKPGTLATHV